MNLQTMLTAFVQYPVTGVTTLAAILLSIGFWLGGDIRGLTMERVWIVEPWRPITSTLLHGNLIHLAFNLSWMLSLGATIERTYGPWRTLLLYLVLAVVPAVAEFALFNGGIGLSGVVYGLAGMLVVVQQRDLRLANTLSPQEITIFIGWFFLCIVLTITNIMPIGNVAHGAGWLMGILIGEMLTTRQSRMGWALGAVAATVLIFLGGSVWRNIISLRPASDKAAERGYLALLDNRNEEAVTHLEEAVALDPSATWAWNNLGLAYERTDQSTKAAKAAIEAFNSNPADPELREHAAWGHTVLGYEALIANDDETALREYKAASAMNPSEPERWEYIAFGLDALGDTAGADAAWARSGEERPKARELDVSQDTGYADLAKAPSKLPVVELEAAADEGGDDAASWREWAHLALAYEREQRNLDAARAFLDAFKRRPSDPDLSRKAAWANLQLALDAKAKGETQAAVSHYRAAAALVDPADTELRKQIAAGLEWYGLQESAWEVWYEAPESPE